MLQAQADFDNGVSVRQLSLKYNIPKTTIHRHINGKHKGLKRSFGRPLSTMSMQQEELVTTRLVNMADAGYPLTWKLLHYFVHQKKVIPGRVSKWKVSFVFRHKEFEWMKPDTMPQSSESVPQADVARFYQLLERKLDIVGHDPSRVYTMGEMHFGDQVC